ncbi:MAG: AraC family transcriptional regulator [Verrucomicrobia bacterium]|nr:AraC family transcriptional regulator [Cytophagales bacterium]
MIYIIGIVITFFLSFILLTKKEKTIADKILFVWLCVIMIHLTMFAIISSQEFLRFSYLLGLEIPLPLLHGPFLFIYTTSLTNGNATLSNKLIHFIPYVLALLSIIPFLLLSPEDKITVYQKEGEGYTTLTNIIFFGIIFSGITYSFLSLRLLVKHKRKIKDNYSYTEQINLQWLFILIAGLSCIWIIVFFANDEIIFSSVVLYVLLIGYFGIKQVGIFTNQPPAENSLALETTQPVELSDIPSENLKYEKSMLADNQLAGIHVEFVQLMKQKKLYLTPELTLTMVSEELDVHPNTLSQVINRVELQNFFDYVNTLRVEEFKERAVRPENQKYTMLSLAYECGFNSKTSFNRNFKKITGKSPTEYLKEIKITLN